MHDTSGCLQFWPVRICSRVFRGKFIDLLNRASIAGELRSALCITNPPPLDTIPKAAVQFNQLDAECDRRFWAKLARWAHSA